MISELRNVVVMVAAEIFSQLSVATNCEAARIPMIVADEDIACKKAGVLLWMVCHPPNSWRAKCTHDKEL
jgi:hypothetical protein